MKWKKFLAGLALFGLVVAIYTPAVRYGFVGLDEATYVIERAWVTTGFTLANVREAFARQVCHIWHPVTMLSHMLDCELFGTSPGPHHAHNVLLHAINSVLLFLLLGAATGRPWRSAVVAALFAVHPLNVESVVSISQRKTLLSTFFWLLGLAAYLRYARKPCVSRYLPAMALQALGLMSKQMLVTFPVTLLLLDAWPLGRFHSTPAGRRSACVTMWFRDPVNRRVLLEKVPLFVLSAVFSALIIYTQKRGGLLTPFESLPIQARIPLVLSGYVRYLLKLVYPVNLSMIYPVPRDVPVTEVIVVCASLVLITDWAFRSRRRYPHVAFGWFWYLAVLFPVSGILQAAGALMADRFTYVPFIGLFVLAVWLAADAVSGRAALRAISLAVLVVILATLVVLSRRQVGFWRSNDELSARALAVTPDHPTTHCVAGYQALNEHRYAEAREHFEAALRLDPNYWDVVGGLALLEVMEGHTNKAIELFSAAAAHQPKSVELRSNLGQALMQQGHFAEAVAPLAEAVRMAPDYTEVRRDLAYALLRSCRYEEALAHYERILRFLPNDVGALVNAAWILAAGHPAERRDPGRAVETARRACERTSFTQPRALDALAAACAAAGRFEDAARYCRQGIALLANDDPMKDAMHKRLALFEAGQVYAMPSGWKL
jgi:tetratricopeptide (TPR) repeat protein